MHPTNHGLHINWTFRRITADEHANYLCLRNANNDTMLAAMPPGFSEPCALAFDSAINALLYLGYVSNWQSSLADIQILPLSKTLRPDQIAFATRPIVLVCPNCDKYLMVMDNDHKYHCDCGLILELRGKPPTPPPDMPTNNTTN